MLKAKKAKKAVKKAAPSMSLDSVVGMRLVRANEICRLGVKHLVLTFENVRTKKRLRLSVGGKKGEELPFVVKDAK